MGYRSSMAPPACAAACLVAAVLLLLLLICTAARPSAAMISCGDAVTAVAPCGGYLVGAGEANPTPQCCRSVRSLGRQASSPPARKELCECFKETGPSFGVRPDRVRSMAAFCKLPLNLPITPNVDCNHV